jgi:hypothetical protein
MLTKIYRAKQSQTREKADPHLKHEAVLAGHHGAHQHAVQHLVVLLRLRVADVREPPLQVCSSSRETCTLGQPCVGSSTAVRSQHERSVTVLPIDYIGESVAQVSRDPTPAVPLAVGRLPVGHVLEGSYAHLLAIANDVHHLKCDMTGHHVRSCSGVCMLAARTLSTTLTSPSGVATSTRAAADRPAQRARHAAHHRACANQFYSAKR